MAKNKNGEFQSLLDCWEPPDKDKEPIGCICTTFTFDASFFEEQCLTRFVKMDSDPSSDGPIYLVEREEKFSMLKCACVLADGHHCKQKRSLRWDLVTFRTESGILHAKISVLYWVNYVRIIIGSANITEDGYTKNQEIFGVLDFYEESDAPYNFLEKVLDYMTDLIEVNETIINPATERSVKLINLIRRNTKSWKKEETYRKNKDIYVHPLFTDSRSLNVFDQIKELWYSYTSEPPRWACITSPFFNPPETENTPAKKIWDILNQRGNAEVFYDIRTEDNKRDTNTIILNAPQSLNYKPKGRPETYIHFRKIDEWEANRYRPIHRKGIFLESDNWTLYLIGSSNFTSPGLALGKNSNLEANIVYIVNKTRNRAGGKLLLNSYIDGDEIDDSKHWKWNPMEDEETLCEENLPALHKGFKSASLNFKDNKYLIELTFDTQILPEKFSIQDEVKRELYSSEKWNSDLKPSNIVIEYECQRPPSVLFVSWNGIKAWWPINIVSSMVLPPIDELKDLPLEVLLNILSSSKPVHKLIGAWLKRKEGNGETGIPSYIDPHKRVNTSQFLLQRTRKISYSLTALKEKLEKPIYTIESLNWRLFGPIGVKALSKAIIETARSEEEKAFLLAETAYELSNIKPKITNETIKTEEYKKAINKVITELKQEVCTINIDSNISIKAYITNLFEEIEK